MMNEHGTGSTRPLLINGSTIDTVCAPITIISSTSNISHQIKLDKCSVSVRGATHATSALLSTKKSVEIVDSATSSNPTRKAKHKISLAPQLAPTLDLFANLNLRLNPTKPEVGGSTFSADFAATSSSNSVHGNGKVSDLQRCVNRLSFMPIHTNRV
jgi:hypothetical protein